jgi:hypothetical protein
MYIKVSSDYQHFRTRDQDFKISRELFKKDANLNRMCISMWRPVDNNKFWNMSVYSEIPFGYLNFQFHPKFSQPLGVYF